MAKEESQITGTIPALSTPNREKRSEQIVVRVSPSELAKINAHAGARGMQRSDYVRVVAQRGEPPNRLEATHMQAMHEHLADLGRLGGLLKWWLTKDESVQAAGPGAEVDIRRTLRAIEGTTQQLRALVANLSRTVLRKRQIGP